MDRFNERLHSQSFDPLLDCGLRTCGNGFHHDSRQHASSRSRLHRTDQLRYRSYRMIDDHGSQQLNPFGARRSECCRESQCCSMKRRRGHDIVNDMTLFESRHEDGNHRPSD